MPHDLDLLPRRPAVRALPATLPPDEPSAASAPSRAEAEEAVRTLLRYVGEDPRREGLLETPARVVRAYDEFFRGYQEDPAAYLARTFDEVEGYDDIVLVRDIRFVSHCEHHMVSFVGHAHVGYLPRGRVVGLSKLARVVDAYARRLQVQEKLCAQIAAAVEEALNPRGVAVVLEARHDCMATRGVHKPEALTLTRRMTGAFQDDAELRREFLQLLRES